MITKSISRKVILKNNSILTKKITIGISSTVFFVSFHGMCVSCLMSELNLNGDIMEQKRYVSLSLCDCLQLKYLLIPCAFRIWMQNHKLFAQTNIYIKLVFLKVWLAAADDQTEKERRRRLWVKRTVYFISGWCSSLTSIKSKVVAVD